MTPRVVTSVAEAEELVGVDLGESEALLIDDVRLRKFAESTGGRMSASGDRDKDAGAPLAEAYLPITLVPFLASQIFSIAFGTARLNYGTDKVRFGPQVKAGSALRARAKLVEVSHRPQGIYVKTEISIRADGAENAACVAETITLVTG